MPSEFHKALQQEACALEIKLARDPTFRRLENIRTLLDAYGNGASTYPKMGITKSMAGVLAFIEDYTSKEGYCPSYQEITNAMGWVSKSNTHRVVHKLYERGLVRMSPNKARSIRQRGAG